MIRKLGNRGEDVLLKNVISVVIFVLSFIAILYGVYKVYTIFLNQEDKNAQVTLDRLSARFNELEEGENATFAVQGFRNSKDWFVVGWNKTDSSRPDKCYFSSCLCVCHVDTDEIISEMCQKRGMCENFKYESVVVDGLSDARDESLRKNLQINTFTLPENIDELNAQIIKLNDNTIMARLSYVKPIQELLDYVNKMTPKGDK